MVSGSLALLLCNFKVSVGSRAAAPRGDKGQKNGDKIRLSFFVCRSVYPRACQRALRASWRGLRVNLRGLRANGRDSGGVLGPGGGVLRSGGGL